MGMVVPILFALWYSLSAGLTVYLMSAAICWAVGRYEQRPRKMRRRWLRALRQRAGEVPARFTLLPTVRRVWTDRMLAERSSLEREMFVALAPDSDVPAAELLDLVQLLAV